MKKKKPNTFENKLESIPVFSTLKFEKEFISLHNHNKSTIECLV